MNVTLISPSLVFSNIGTRTIYSYLKSAGHKVRLVFLPKGDYINTEENLKYPFFQPKENPNDYDKQTIDSLIELSKDSDMIGLSLTTNFFEDSAQITKALKKELKIPIVWGGIHPTVSPEECLKYADIVCRGEGEEAIAELAEKIEKKESYCNVKNLCFKDNQGNVVINPVRPLIQDLDSIPFQDYDFENQYIIIKGKSYKVDEIISDDDLWPFNKTDTGIYRIMFTRGCPFGCTYCCNNFLNKMYSGQRVFRKRSVDNVIEELKIINKNLSYINFIMFQDDNFLGLSLKEIKDFSEKYKKEIKLPFMVAGVSLINISYDKIKFLVEAGLFGLRMGIQSGSEKTIKLYKRNYSNS